MKVLLLFLVVSALCACDIFSPHPPSPQELERRASICVEYALNNMTPTFGSSAPLSGDAMNALIAQCRRASGAVK